MMRLGDKEGVAVGFSLREQILPTYLLLLATLSSNEVLLKSRQGRDAPQAKRAVAQEIRDM